ncbi:hypothetical protein HYDPIDRAFT_56796, partial [Hydnomerulius pinastri MD-312]
TWQTRNPGQPVIQPRAAPPRQTAAEKASRGIVKAQNATKAKLLDNAIEAFMKEQKSKLEALARQHDVTVDHVKQLIGGETHYHTTCKAQLRNALVHAKALEVNKDRPIGSKFSMAEIQKMVQEDLKTRTVTCTEEEEYIAQLAEHRHVKVHGIRANNTAAARDVLVTVDRVATELENLRDRTGIYATLFVTHGHINDSIQSTWASTDNSADFWDDVIQKPIADIASQYEQWACTQNQSRSLFLSESVSPSLIADLMPDLITGKGDIPMNYLNYDKGIVQAYGVQLINWPPTVKFANPSTIGTVVEIRRLRDTLKTGTCTWKKLSRRELDAHSAEVASRIATGEVVKKRRKKRSDAGVARK